MLASIVPAGLPRALTHYPHTACANFERVELNKIPPAAACHHDLVKSSRRATGRPASSSAECLRLSLFGAPALAPGSTLPSTSSRGTPLSFLAGFGSLDGCDGYGSAKKYGWSSAYSRVRA